MQQIKGEPNGTFTVADERAKSNEQRTYHKRYPQSYKKFELFLIFDFNFETMRPTVKVAISR